MAVALALVTSRLGAQEADAAGDAKLAEPPAAQPQAESHALEATVEAPLVTSSTAPTAERGAAPMPTPERAAPAPAPPAKEVLYGWSVGAGILGGFGLYELGSINSLMSSPSYGVALERRLGGQTWIGLNVMGAYQKREVPVNAIMSNADPKRRLELEVTDKSASLLLAIRQVFVEDVVDVSVYLGAFAGYQATDGERPTPEEQLSIFYDPGSKRRVIGILAGFAVERELIEALGLRLTLDVGRASITRSQSVDTDFDDNLIQRDLTTHELGLSVRPGLGVNFYF